MSLFRLDASIRQEGSISREVADTVTTAWLESREGSTVVRRDIGAEPISASTWSTAVYAAYIDAADRTPEQTAAVAVATELADELISSEAAVIAVPLYNFGIAAHVKAWLDLLITDPRLSSGAPQVLAGRPVVLVVARGGGYGVGTPREGWDHATPYLQRIFGDVWGMDVHIVEAELTLADVVPAMEALRGIAAESRADAHVSAKVVGGQLMDLAAAAA